MSEGLAMVGAHGADHRTGGSGWRVGREKGKRVCTCRLGTPCVVLHAGFQFYFGYRGAFTKRKKEPSEASLGREQAWLGRGGRGLPKKGREGEERAQRLARMGAPQAVFKGTLLTTNVTEGQCCYFRRLHRLDFFPRPLYKNMQNI